MALTTVATAASTRLHCWRRREPGGVDGLRNSNAQRDILGLGAPGERLPDAVPKLPPGPKTGDLHSGRQSGADFRELGVFGRIGFRGTAGAIHGRGYARQTHRSDRISAFYCDRLEPGERGRQSADPA